MYVWMLLPMISTFFFHDKAYKNKQNCFLATAENFFSVYLPYVAGIPYDLVQGACST